jgi:hypothetical protein
MNPSIPFNLVKIGELFRYNGNDYAKQSTRTAMLLDNCRPFYFKQTEQVHIVKW